MSVQKLIAEAEKLLDKKKPADAIERLKSALSLEPLNQLVTTRLANIYLEQNDRPSAAKAHAVLAQRLSEAGKSAIAIAVYKQAIDIQPENMEIRVTYARECEEMGKVGDAQAQAQTALQYYLRRKKYLDASTVMPLLIRLNNRDDLKAAWIETIQLSLGEQRLSHLLVALCGPPGLVSTEFNVGGDASALSDGLYEGLKTLSKYFPREPRIPYAVAWAALRRGRKKDFYEYARESVRREPDFCLTYLLLARTFAEENRLSEALFIFKILKERLHADRSVDMVTLNRLVDSFVEKSPWITIGETGGARDLEPAEFLKLLRGEAAATVAAPASSPALAPVSAPEASPAITTEPTPAPAAETNPASPTAPEPLVAREAEISFGIDAETGSSATPGAVLVAQEVSVSIASLSLGSAAITPPAAAAAVSTPAPAAAPPAPAPAVERDDSVEFTNIIKVSPEFQAEGVLAAEGDAGSPDGEVDPSSLLLAAEPPPEEFAADPAPATTLTPAPKMGFNPLEGLDQESVIRALENREEKTEMFSPMDVLAAKDSVRERYEDVKTRFVVEPTAPAPGSETAASAAPAPVSYDGLFVEGDATQIFSPMDAVAAAGESRRPVEKSAPAPMPAPVAPAKILEETGALNLAESGDATMVLQVPASASAPEFSAEPAHEFPREMPIAASAFPPEAAPFDALVKAADAGGGATQVMSADEILPADLFAHQGQAEGDAASEATAVMTVDNGPVIAAAPVITFQPIPQLNVAAKPAPAPAPAAAPVAPPPSSPAFAAAPAPVATPAAAEEEVVDLGDDLLQEPTRVLIAPPKLSLTAPESTRHLLQEIRKEVRENKATEPDADAMLRRAERYIVKQNFYLARKALRLALDLGAEEERVKSRLRDIRKIEMPTSLYHSASNDDSGRERSAEILERLETEFGIGAAEEETDGLLSESVTNQLERIFRESDAQTILDFGVGLHEMGLFRQAEDVFTRITAQFPEHAFDAYYLAAVTKFSRRDYAGAASILKHLSAEVGRSEEDKIQIYYTLGELFECMQRPESSREFFKKVAQLDSNYRNVRHKLEG